MLYDHQSYLNIDKNKHKRKFNDSHAYKFIQENENYLFLNIIRLLQNRFS